MPESILLPQLFKTEYRKIISVLCKLLGTSGIATAEDIANDTFLLASETWGLKGVPDNPTAWLYTVAKNKTKDQLKRSKLFEEKISPEFAYSQSSQEAYELDLSAENISDSQLRMIFVVCNPVIPVEAQIGLALRILCGFGIEEIAQAFLTNKETINKRLFRAKEKLRTENIQVEIPAEQDINQRIEAVLATIYLLFNEGYYSSTHTDTLRKELCLEAMRLNYLLLETPQTTRPAVHALLSLMCFHASRFEARKNTAGHHILYDDQDRNLWNDELIAKGNYYLIESARGQEISKYHLEASIAYWHCTKTATNKWTHILQLYNQILQIAYSPAAALNRTYALAQVYGPQTAIPEAEKLGLDNNHLYHALIGYLYTGIDNKKAVSHFRKAHDLAHTEADRVVMMGYINGFSERQE